MLKRSLTLAEYRELLQRQKGNRPKYHNRRQVFDGISFDSGAEVTRYCELRILEKAGEITDLRPTPENPKKPFWYFKRGSEYMVIRSEGYPNGRKVRFTADFSYRAKGRLVVEDVKGNAHVTNLYETKLKIAMMELFHGIRVQIVETVPLSARQAHSQRMSKPTRRRKSHDRVPVR